MTNIDPGAESGSDGENAVLFQLRPGDRIQAWERGIRRHVGTVETVAADLGVVWIVEAGLGARRLLTAQQYHLCPWTPQTRPTPGTSSTETAERPPLPSCNHQHRETSD